MHWDSLCIYSALTMQSQHSCIYAVAVNAGDFIELGGADTSLSCFHFDFKMY
jgi:hypothetical protein